MINQRLAELSDYPFTRLSRLLAGVEPPPGLVPMVFSVGEPQHGPPDLIERVLREHRALWGRYPAVAGTPEFRAAVVGWLGRRYPATAGRIDPDLQVLPVSGTREALFQTALLTVSPRADGRRPAVLMPNPFYAVYEGAAVLAGAEPVFLETSPATGHLPDLDALTPGLLARTALFYLCTPANPQGVVADRAYLARALALAREYGFVLAIDECYAEVWQQEPPPGALEVAAQTAGDDTAWRQLLVFHSLSKRSGAAGLRSGFVAGDPALIAAFGRLRSYALAGTPLPLLAAATALWQDDDHVVAIRARYRENFDAAAAVFGERFGFYRPAGGFFLWLDVGDGEQAARRLWTEAALRVLPGAYLTRPSADGHNAGQRYLRVALVHEAAAVTSACQRIVDTLERSPDVVD